ncbi:hypothetical protein JTE90_021503 [Oedothorax gibbosus]|uniref:18S rRNA cytosine acetyltransferase n=1 Tax=Oedothorax gibbosus TaxID=931172 RepID=A0AAV6VQD2_9ARAC|nr:hypothetical protein JTE90_021503 [Oedothorax gibbosus]
MRNQDLSSLLVISDTLTEAENSVYLLCRTASQISALETLQKALDSSDDRVVSLSSGRGRGKSAILGLAVALGLSRGGPMHVIVTSPNPENLKSFFDFVGRGLEAVGFREGTEYNIVKNPSGVITSILISHMSKRGRVVYHTPLEHHAAAAADLAVIDEAAAIPLALVKGWMRQGLTIFMASTIQGYEGTGRSLSLKLLKELRNPFKETDHMLEEVNLTEPIRYSNGDPVEEWLHRLLCLEAVEDQLFEGILPAPEDCQLYNVYRKNLFCLSQGSETFLQNLVSLFVVSHYKNSPNDLLMMADAPAHRIFCLIAEKEPNIPLCAIQIALEGDISPESSQSEQSQGRRSSGDLIPWIISQQFQDHEFPSLLGARIVRIATHPAYQGMGYGRRALELLSLFYSSPRTDVCKKNEKTGILMDLKLVKDRRPLKYLGVSYGLTSQLFNFWKKAGFVPVYIRQTTSNVTGEHSCVMLKNLRRFSPWLDDFYMDFVSRFFPLLPTAFRQLPTPLVIQVLQCTSVRAKALPEAVVQFACTPRSILRLGAYCRGEVDYHLIVDLLPNLAPMMLMGRLDDGYSRHYSRECVLVGVGLQSKTPDVVADELQLDPSIVMGIFRKAVKKILVAIQNRPTA